MDGTLSLNDLQLCSSGFPGALPDSRPHHAVPAADRRRAPVDFGERGAGDFRPPSGSGLLPAASGLLPGRHGDTPALPAARGGVYRPQEPQIRHEAAVGDLGLNSSLLLRPAGMRKQ